MKQRKTNAMWSHLNVEFEKQAKKQKPTKNKLIAKEFRYVVTWGGRGSMRELGECDQDV